MKHKNSEEKTNVGVLPLQKMQATLKLKGTTSLLMNKFTDKAKESMVARQVKQTRQKEARDIQSEVEQAIHRMPNGDIGFPSCGFKKAMVEAAVYLDGLDKKLVKGSIQIPGNLIKINFKKQVVNEAVVRLGGFTRKAMVRYRPEFQEWSCELPILFNSAQISLQQLVQLANTAGFHIGVGEWTPQRSGSYGMFEVDTKGSGI